MGNRRRFVASSDDESDAPRNGKEEVRLKRKIMKLVDEEEEEEEHVGLEKKSKAREEEDREALVQADDGDEEEEEEATAEDAKPLGDPIRVSGRGQGRKNHYNSFEYDGNRYDLEDPVLLVPEEAEKKPYVAIIKDISQTRNGSLMVTGQWFYRPEEAEKKAGGNWESTDTRELFYSFHRDQVPAESVMHKCVVHFIPLNKQIPYRKQHPGFIVQRVYDTDQRKLFKLTDKDYEDNKQEEIDLLVQKTMSRLKDLPDIEPNNAAADHEHQMRTSRLQRRKSMNMTPLDVSREDEAPSKAGQSSKVMTPGKVETPGSASSIPSEYYTILSSVKALTGETPRDKWMEKVLKSIKTLCHPPTNGESAGQSKGTPKNGNGIQKLSDNLSNCWPDGAVTAVVALEKACHESQADFTKYNQKMRSLHFNLGTNAVLAGRFVNGELKPAQMIKMSPDELKEGLTAEEIAHRQPEETEHIRKECKDMLHALNFSPWLTIQMTDARCKRCGEKKVGLTEIIQTGHGDRYQLDCIPCGNSWYTSRDEASVLSIDVATPATPVGVEGVEKKLMSPRRSDGDVLKKEG